MNDAHSSSHSKNASAKWLPRPPRTARVRLFCLPYAGGGASIYREWDRRLGSDIDVCPVQLPGREERLRERPHSSMEDLITPLARALAPWVDTPYALFGHSMGALIAHEAARHLATTVGRPPVHLIVSGSSPPCRISRERPIASLPRDEFLSELKRLNGTSASVFANEELMDLLIPLLRADLRLVEGYRLLPGARLDCPVTVLWGLRDPRTRAASIGNWSTTTNGRCRAIAFDGDHFFVRAQAKEVTACIREVLLECADSERRVR